jgi:hypothetical protein
MILAINENLSLKTIIPIYTASAFTYGFYRGYTYLTRENPTKKVEPSSLTFNFINGITLGISSLILIPFNLKHILTRSSGATDIL